MSSSAPARTTSRAVAPRVAAAILLVCSAAIGASILVQPAWSPPIPMDGVAGGDPEGALAVPDDSTEADGVLPDGATAFDDRYAGVANLDPALLQALRAAASDAAASGVRFRVVSGWRSPEYQTRLLREAVSQYGSEAEAARWVATPDTSAHVSGHAVDIGPFDATAWLSGHGAAYGLCQIYGNEPWHYELHPAAIDHGCPPMYADPTEDPRMLR